MSEFGFHPDPAGTGTTDSSNADNLLWCKWTTPADMGTVNNVYVYARAYSSLGAKCVILSGDLTTVVSVSDALTMPVDGVFDWRTFTWASPPTLSSNTLYSFGLIWSVSGDFLTYWDADVPGAVSGWADGNSYTTPAPPTVDGTGTEACELYITYTASGGGPTPLTAALTDSLIYG